MKIFPPLLLASKSPRRHQLLKEAGFSFEFVDIDVAEDYPVHLQKEAVATFLAEKKARAFEHAIGNHILVTADTIVCIENEVINKPADYAEALSMLQKLSGRMHEVFTAVCMKNDNKTKVFFDRTEVFFYPLTDAQIDYYIRNYKPFDKAGSYGVQDWMGYVGVEKINGCFYNVMGFPIGKFYRELLQFIG